MIAKHPTKQDWFRVDVEDAKPLLGLPGLHIEGARFIAHRGLLTLLDHPTARSLLAEAAPKTTWAARNIWTGIRGFQLRTTQHQAIDFIEPRKGVLLGDDMRLGKGQVVGSRLLGPQGWFPIEAARIGDLIMGSDGEAHLITGVFPRGLLPVYRVTFSDGTSIVVDGEHLWATWSHNDWHRHKPHRVMRTRDLIKLRDAANNMQWRIPLVKPLNLWGCPDPALDPYLLGVLLGDGYFGESVTFCCGDEETPQQVSKVLPPGVRLVRGDTVGRTSTWRLSRIDASKRNPLKSVLTRLGLFDTRSWSKFVPDRYLFANNEDRLALLQGLLDTDGEYSGGTLAFSSASEKLRDAVRFLVESLGGVARVSTREAPRYMYDGETRIGRPSYRLTIAMPDNIKPFRARKGYKQREKFRPARHIASIEPAGEAEVICISVDAPDQLYVTEHCIVTHNTLTAIMCHDPARGPFVVVAPLSTRGVWLGWLKRVFPEHADNIGVLRGRKFDPELVKKPIVFAHYDIIAQWMNATKIGTLVFDEAHVLTNRTAKRSLAAIYLRTQAERVIALTGTPIWDLPSDLWNIVGLVAPGGWGSYHDFCQRYGAPENTAYGVVYTGLSHGAELKERMTEIMLRRRWADVSEDVPAITRSVVVSEVDDAARRRLDILSAKIQSERTNTAGNLAAYRRQITSTKLSTVKHEITKVISRNEPVVVWTWHKDYADAIAKEFPERAHVIHGDVAPEEREKRIEAWRASSANVLIATMAVAQVGVDFSHARIAIFAEIDYTPAIIGQAEMRTFAPTRGMDVIFIVANHLVDQRIVRALVRKLSAADPLGVGAAVDAIDALRDAVIGPNEEGDLDRLLEDLLASAA